MEGWCVLLKILAYVMSDDIVQSIGFYTEDTGVFLVKEWGEWTGQELMWTNENGWNLPS